MGSIEFAPCGDERNCAAQSTDILAGLNNRSSLGFDIILLVERPMHVVAPSGKRPSVLHTGKWADIIALNL